jgi:hypothetical protein
LEARNRFKIEHGLRDDSKVSTAAYGQLFPIGPDVSLTHRTTKLGKLTHVCHNIEPQHMTPHITVT